MKTGIWGLLLALSIAVLGGCADAQMEKNKKDAQPKEVVVSNMPDESSEEGKQVLSDKVAVGKPAPDFELPDENGKKWKLSDYKGKVVLLDFWGFWCSYCVQELPELRDMNDKFSKKDFVMIGINTDTDDIKDIKKALAEHKVNWRQGMMPEPTDMATDYDVTGFPTKVLIDKEGKIVYIDNFITEEQLAKYLN